jgi:hypothetical protein
MRESVQQITAAGGGRLSAGLREIKKCQDTENPEGVTRRLVWKGATINSGFAIIHCND